MRPCLSSTLKRPSMLMKTESLDNSFKSGVFVMSFENGSFIMWTCENVVFGCFGVNDRLGHIKKYIRFKNQPTTNQPTNQLASMQPTNSLTSQTNKQTNKNHEPTNATARVANQSARFGSSCPLAELAI